MTLFEGFALSVAMSVVAYWLGYAHGRASGARTGVVLLLLLLRHINDAGLLETVLQVLRKNAGEQLKRES